jgi:hypothetical protein
MNRIKNALVDILWLMLAAIPMILVGLVFEAAAVYASFVLLAGLFFGMEALGPVQYVVVGISAVVGAGAILLCVRQVNRGIGPQSVDYSVPTPVGRPESE